MTELLVRLGRAQGYAYMLSATRLHVDFQNQTTDTYVAPGGFVIGHAFENERQGLLNQYFVPFQRLDELEKQRSEVPGVRVLKKMAFGRNRLFSFFWENHEDKPKLLFVVVTDPASERKVSSFWLDQENRSEQERQYPELRDFDLTIAHRESV